MNDKYFKIISIKDISPTAFVLRTEKRGFKFVPGQCATIGIPEEATNREYSLYSGVRDDYLEFLIKEVKDGVFSTKLHALKAGTEVSIDGAYGLFNVNDPDKKYYLIATGTGIAPFHSMVKSYPKLNYTIVHGVREESETYNNGDYKNYVACVSSRGLRVTDYLKNNILVKEAEYLLCGNSQMINDVYDLLREKGINGSFIHSESFF